MWGVPDNDKSITYNDAGDFNIAATLGKLVENFLLANPKPIPRMLFLLYSFNTKIYHIMITTTTMIITIIMMMMIMIIIDTWTT